jgi:signal transduction histidine kinase
MSRIAHELKTPLTSIVGFTELLLINDSLKNDEKEYIKSISQSGLDMEKMINDLFDMSKISVQNIHWTDVSINESIKEIVNSFIPSMDKRKIITNFYQKDSQHIISIDESKFKQVFKNLMSNAVKYNKESGTINIKCYKEGDNLNISIRDTGIGIPKNKMQDLYLPFNRLGLTSDYEGSGIGLAYSKKILDIMNGKIKCNSVLSEYTEFIITFNIKEEKEEDKEMDTIFSNKKPKLNILYIEDVKSTIKLVQKIIEKFYDVNFYYSETGEDGLKKLKDIKIDILLLDLGLPLVLICAKRLYFIIIHS